MWLQDPLLCHLQHGCCEVALEFGYPGERISAQAGAYVTGMLEGIRLVEAAVQYVT